MSESIRAHGASQRERRYGAFLDAAETLFLACGYERTSLAQIVKLSGGSLTTLYELFGNKQGLLQAIAARWRDEAIGNRFDSEPAGRQSNRETLRRYAHHLAETMRSPRSIALTRILISESLRDHAFAEQIHNDLHLREVRNIADLFAEWAEGGTAKISAPEAAAKLFLSTISGQSIINILSGVEDDDLDPAQVDWRLAPFFTFFGIS